MVLRDRLLAEAEVAGLDAIDLNVELRIVQGLGDLHVRRSRNAAERSNHFFGHVTALGKGTGGNLYADRRRRPFV